MEWGRLNGKTVFCHNLRTFLLRLPSLFRWLDGSRLPKRKGVWNERIFLHIKEVALL